MPRLFLLDGTALAYRAHFALQRSGLTTSAGKPTGAVYGFTTTLRRILEVEKPDLVAVALDPKGPTFRHRLYEPYKATRQKAPVEMLAQLDDIREVVRALGITLYEVPGYEADDVIGTLACEAEARGMEVLIVTGDKDLMQLVSDRVRLYNVFKPRVDLVIEGIAEVREKFCADPDHVVDVLAIMGDASDNVPGVHGIGEKGAIKLIAEFGSVENMLAQLDRVKGKVRELIERDREVLLLSRRLVTIDRHVPLDPGIEGIRPPVPDPHALQALFRRLDFQSLANKIAQDAVPRPSALERDYHLVRDRAQLDAMLAELREAGAFAVDTETTGLFPLQADIVGASFSARAGRAFYVPFNQDPPVLPGGRAELLDALRPLLTDERFFRAGQNYKFDALVFHHAGIDVLPPSFDTMVASYCVAGSMRRHNIDELALTYFDLQKIPTSALIGTGKSQVSMADVPIERVAEYACEDADVAWRLKEVLERELEEKGAAALYYDLELPLVPVLTAMERRGIRLDTAILQVIGKDLEREMSRAIDDIHALAGEVFNVNSTKVLGAILFEKLRIHEAAGIKRPKKTKTGWSTDAATLENDYPDVRVVARLLEYREVQKLKSTYIDTLPGFVNPETGRIHCSFSQVTAATGRLASSDPNLQNIPIRSERGRKLRGAFVAREPDEWGEWVLLSADYSQVELRIMAHLSGDPSMARAFAEGRDIHASTAAIVFDVPPDEVDRAMRSRAKAINFGLLYGMGAARLARETGLSIPEARGFIERYFASFPRVREWLDRTLAQARERGYVETILGRRRPMPELSADDARTRVMAENAAVNTPVQGSAADIIKKAMIDLEARLARSTSKAQLLLQVHDELLLEVPVREVAQTTELVRECMVNAVALSVPLEVEFGHGKSWLEAH